MNQVFARSILIGGALSLMGIPWGGGENDVSKVHAAPWIAPAPQQELAAKWVENVAREFRKPQFRNIFMNVPGGSPQATILDLLNEAAVGLENGESGYARQLVRRAINVLDRHAGEGWYSESDIQPIQAMILRNAKQGFQEADQKWKSRKKTSQRYSNESFHRDRVRGARLFNPDEPNSSDKRWDGYTSDHWQGGGQSDDRTQNWNIRQDNNDFGRSGDRTRQRASMDRNQNMRNGDGNSFMERGGTQRYYSDDFYYSDYPWEDRGGNRSARRGQDSGRDQMSWSMEQNRRQHARGKAGFYQEQPEDRGQQRPFDRGPGQDQYFESTTRNHSRGYNQ